MKAPDHIDPPHAPVVVPSFAEGVTAPVDRMGALRFAGASIAVIAVIALGMLGVEQLVLHYPERLGPLVSGFPVDRIMELERVPTQIVYFGDSVVQTAATGDTDARLLPDMVAADLDEPVMRISQAATAVDLHAAWLRFAARARPTPRAVIIPVNLRSFSPHWERNPGWVFEDVAAMIDHPLFSRLGSVLEWDWGRPSDEAYRATPVYVNGALVGTLEELDVPTEGWMPPESVRRSRYLVRYAPDVTRSRRFAALRDLVAAANACPFPVILYLTPIDVDRIRENVDADTYGAVEANLDALRSELGASRWPVVDVSEAVRAADFDHPLGDPHEHLKWPGRRIVAEAVADALREAGIGGPSPLRAPLPSTPDATTSPNDAGTGDEGPGDDGGIGGEP